MASSYATREEFGTWKSPDWSDSVTGAHLQISLSLFLSTQKLSRRLGWGRSSASLEGPGCLKPAEEVQTVQAQAA